VAAAATASIAHLKASGAERAAQRAAVACDESRIDQVPAYPCCRAITLHCACHGGRRGTLASGAKRCVARKRHRNLHHSRVNLSNCTARRRASCALRRDRFHDSALIAQLATAMVEVWQQPRASRSECRCDGRTIRPRSVTAGCDMPLQRRVVMLHSLRPSQFRPGQLVWTPSQCPECDREFVIACRISCHSRALLRCWRPERSNRVLCVSAPPVACLAGRSRQGWG